MRICDFELRFKKDFSNIEIEGVTAIAINFVASNNDLFSDDAIGADDFIYSSTSQYAMLSINDGLVLSVPFYIDNIEKDELEVSHFAITENNMLIMVCHDDDDDENYFYFEIEPSEFY